MTSGAERTEIERLAASAWLFRHAVEREAHVRFARLARDLASIGAPAEAAERARRASEDERRHAALCAELAAELGATVDDVAPVSAPEIAPSGLTARGRVLYELVAACCITETESMAVLTTLLDAARTDRLRAILRELATDEVQHSRLGWMHLAAEHAAAATAFLAPLVPAMLEGTAPPDLFQAVALARDDERLLGYGVLPHALKREVFTGTLEQVVFPGLERCGVDAGPARAWLAARRRGTP